MSDDQLSGRSLDALVAERVMEWTIIEAKGENWFDAIPSDRFPIFVRWPEGGTAVYESPFEFRSREFRPSESIEAAMQVVEKLRGAGVWTQIMIYQHTTQVHVEMGVPSSECQEWGSTAAEAICRCALKAQEKFELFAERLAALKAMESE